MMDVCLILEGTYPFVSGGVSSWIHQLISTMPDVRFSILSISPYPNPRRQYKYRIPENVFDIQDIYLHELKVAGRLSRGRLRREGADAVFKAMERLVSGDLDAFTDGLKYLRDPEVALSAVDVFKSPESWDKAIRFYERYADDVSFLDFFWTMRSLLLPMVNTLSCPIPPARMYHVVSTGYAGLLASIAKATRPAGLVLTEHGVYTHERLLEISQATWIYTPQKERFRVQENLSYFKRVWLGFFDLLGRLTYRHADRIITLFEGNKKKQIDSGAPPEKISIVPNGIDVKRWKGVSHQGRSSKRKTVAMVGRVVPIKDVKTFLHAVKILKRSNPGTRFVILGPTDEEPDYFQECEELVRALELGGTVEFLGRVDLLEWMPKIDVVVLTSLSEAQPLVILEANAAGVPVVASDVGSCRELLEGRDSDDKRIGASGLLTGVAHPEQTAKAIQLLLEDEALWDRLSESGRVRVATYYDERDLISRYRNLYEEMMR